MYLDFLRVNQENTSVSYSGLMAMTLEMVEDINSLNLYSLAKEDAYEKDFLDNPDNNKVHAITKVMGAIGKVIRKLLEYILYVVNFIRKIFEKIKTWCVKILNSIKMVGLDQKMEVFKDNDYNAYNEHIDNMPYFSSKFFNNFFDRISVIFKDTYKNNVERIAKAVDENDGKDALAYLKSMYKDISVSKDLTVKDCRDDGSIDNIYNEYKKFKDAVSKLPEKYNAWYRTIEASKKEMLQIAKQAQISLKDTKSSVEYQEDSSEKSKDHYYTADENYLRAKLRISLLRLSATFMSKFAMSANTTIQKAITQNLRVYKAMVENDNRITKQISNKSK